jgi:hypothetical protein
VRGGWSGGGARTDHDVFVDSNRLEYLDLAISQPGEELFGRSSWYNISVDELFVVNQRTGGDVDWKRTGGTGH